MHIGASERGMIPRVTTNSYHALLRHVARSPQKPLFIDMGSNLGQGFEYFSQFYSPNCFDYWFVEPNPFLHSDLSKKLTALYQENQWTGKGRLIPEAISSFNGSTKLFGLVEDSRGKTSDGASIVRNHNSIYYESNDDLAIEVKTVRATDMINQASSDYSIIVVKMDIEGAEYDALEDLIASGAIALVDHLYVEFHSQCVKSQDRQSVMQRETVIKDRLGEKLFAWI